MNVIAIVYNSIKQKRNPKKEAARLHMSLSQYLKIKDQILRIMKEAGPVIDEKLLVYIQQKITLDAGSEITLELETPSASKITDVEVNTEEGTQKITVLTATEPRTPEEIMQICKVDPSKWRLKQYWNKEKYDRWQVSANFAPIDDQTQVEMSFLELLSQHEIPAIKPLRITRIPVNKSSDEVVCGVLSLQDVHFGKTGNENIAQIMQEAMFYLASKAHKNYHLKKLILIIGPDLLNMDTFTGTTTKGTPVENSEHAVDAYLKAFEAVSTGIATISQLCDELEVVFISGNHDRLSSFHLLHAVQQSFKTWKNISFDITYGERKVSTFGNNMFCYEHGDIVSKNNPLLYAVEYPEQWGATKYRTLFTGHYHGKKTKEYITENEEHGFRTKILPALTSSDYYHYHNKYVGNRRAATIELHDIQKGLLSEFTYTV